MKKREHFILIVLFYSFFISCSDFKNKSFIKSSDSEELSIQTGIELYAIRLLENETKSKAEHLKTYFSPICLTEDPNRGIQEVPNGKVVLIPGVCFKISSKDQGYRIKKKVESSLKLKGYKLFICDGNDLNDSLRIAIIRCDDEFTPLVYMQTNGINYDISTGVLISKLDSLNAKLDLEIIGADFDWCEFEIKKEPDDWFKLAKYLNHLCPDIVEQGTENVEYLANELKRNRRIYLWFD